MRAESFQGTTLLQMLCHSVRTGGLVDFEADLLLENGWDVLLSRKDLSSIQCQKVPGLISP